MASTGLILAGAGASNSPGDVSWSSPTNITANDNFDATCTLGKNDESYYLLASDFGFSIPDGSVINGVTVTIERASTDGVVEELAVQLYMAGDLSVQNKATGAWPATDTSKNYGGAADTWGESLTPALVNVSTFGVVIKVTVFAAAKTAYVDWVGMDINYTPPVGQPYDLHEGGVRFVNPHSGGQNFNVFRKMLEWRKSLSGLLLPSDPLEGLRHG